MTLVDSCDNRTYTVETLDSSNYTVEFDNIGVIDTLGGKNITFQRIATNSSSAKLGAIVIDVEQYYSTSINTIGAAHWIRKGIIINHDPYTGTGYRAVAVDDLIFTNATYNNPCCNSCCPGVYTYKLTAYHPYKDREVLVKAELSVKIDANGTTTVL